MDCKQADLLFMQYAEKKLEPSDAKNLAMHLLVCEGCRESFVAFDICLDEAPLMEAPEGFTQNVMAQVKELGASRLMWWQVAIGFAAILVGTLLFVLFNFGYGGDFLGSLYGIILYVGVAITPFLESISASLGASPQFGVVTFLFVPFLSVLLFVLHNTEKKVEA